MLVNLLVWSVPLWMLGFTVVVLWCLFGSDGSSGGGSSYTGVQTNPPTFQPEYPTRMPCSSCGGIGSFSEYRGRKPLGFPGLWVDDYKYSKCYACSGTGYVRR
jgi:hypothetical protein